MSVEFKYCHKRALRHLDSTYLAHPLLSLLLFLEQFPLPGDVASVTLGSHILPDSLDRFPRNNLRPDCRLDSDVELLSRNQLFKLLADLPPEIICMVDMDKARQRICRLTVQQDVKLEEALAQLKDREYGHTADSLPRIARFGMVFCGAKDQRRILRLALADIVSKD